MYCSHQVLHPQHSEVFTGSEGPTPRRCWGARASSDPSSRPFLRDAGERKQGSKPRTVGGIERTVMTAINALLAILTGAAMGLVGLPPRPVSICCASAR
ncbi:hypothetical protein ANANG_G00209790, partial [Anguilla anguilla]